MSGKTMLDSLGPVIVKFSRATELCSGEVISNASIPPSIIKIIAEHGTEQFLQNIFSSDPDKNPLLGIPGIERLKSILDEKKDEGLSSLTVAAALFLSLTKITSGDSTKIDQAIELSNVFADEIIVGHQASSLKERANNKGLSDRRNTSFLPFTFNKSARTRISEEMREEMNNNRLRRGLSREWVVSTLSQQLREKGMTMDAGRLFNLTHYRIKDKPFPDVPSVVYDTLVEIYEARLITHTIPSEKKYEAIRFLIEEAKITKQDFRALCKRISSMDVRAINTVYDWIRDNQGSVPLELTDGIRKVLSRNPS